MPLLEEAEPHLHSLLDKEFLQDDPSLAHANLWFAVRPLLTALHILNCWWDRVGNYLIDEWRKALRDGKKIRYEEWEEKFLNR